jgi:hypothetical protein
MPQKRWPVTIDEAVGVVIAALSEEERASIAGLAQAQLIGLHFGLGLWIRNSLGLGEGNDELMQAIRERDQSIHPDSASMVIVEALWERMREKGPKALMRGGLRPRADVQPLCSKAVSGPNISPESSHSNGAVDAFRSHQLGPCRRRSRR